MTKTSNLDIVGLIGNTILSTGRLVWNLKQDRKPDTRKTIDLIFKRANICTKTKERATAEKLYPKFVRQEMNDNNKVFVYKLPPGLGFDKVEQSISVIESYLKSEVLPKVLENDRTAHFSFTVLSGHMRDYIEYSNEETLIKDNGLWIPVGWSRRGLEQVNLGNDSSCHVLIGGASGAGKSTLAKFILTMMHLKYTPEELSLWLADLKHGADTAVLGDEPRLVERRISEPEELEEMIDELTAEVRRRYEIFKKARCGANIGLYNEKEKQKMKRIILFVDEYTKLEGKEFDKTREKMTKLTGEARGAGVHVIVSCHRPNFDLISGTMKNNMSVVVAFKCNQVSAQMLLGGKEEARMAKVIDKDIKGRAVLSYADNVYVQVPYIKNSICEEIMSQYQKVIDIQAEVRPMEIVPIQTV